ncbi:MAG: hypothetical protein AAF702_33160 [Chloroflexota bacterium]
MFISFILQLIAYVGLAAEHLIYGTLTHQMLPMTLMWVGLAFLGYILSIWQGERQEGIPPTFIWTGAILFRGLLLLTIPTLSTDVYRYLWDGYVANNGVSPYAFPIDSPQLDWLDIAIRSQANHTWMASPYLPAAQALFGTITWLLPLHPASMQVVMILVDLANGVLLGVLLVAVGIPRHRVLVYLWNPLVIIEIAQGAHVDGWMIFITLGAIYMALSTVKWLSWMAPILLALATLTKILPGFLVAVLFWRWRWLKLLLFGSVAAGFLYAAGLRAGWGLFGELESHGLFGALWIILNERGERELLGELDGHGLFGALRIYMNQWNYNSGLFHWMEETLGPDGLMGWSEALANRGAKRIAGLFLLLLLGLSWLWARKFTAPLQLMRLMAIPLGGYILLTATVHPWYLLLVLAFVPFLTPSIDESTTQWLWALPWLYLSAALFLSYLTYLDPANLREYEWIRRTEWLPTIGLLLIALAIRGLPNLNKKFSLS